MSEVMNKAEQLSRGIKDLDQRQKEIHTVVGLVVRMVQKRLRELSFEKVVSGEAKKHRELFGYEPHGSVWSILFYWPGDFSIQYGEIDVCLGYCSNGKVTILDLPKREVKDAHVKLTRLVGGVEGLVQGLSKELAPFYEAGKTTKEG